VGKVMAFPDVLTLKDAAQYLRLPKGVVRDLAAQERIPARLIEKRWRFLKAALDDWLRGNDRADGRARMLQVAGAFADDETLSRLVEAAYEERGRLEVADNPRM
jgi:excisionase family DNA binding protein